MRKLKLLMASLALTLGGVTASAYSTSDLTSAGWTQVTDLSTLTLGDYYFVFVDAGASATAMAVGNPATNDRPSYTTLTNPFAASQQVWIIAASGSNYTIQNYVNNKYFISGNAGWNDSMSDNADMGDFTFTQDNGKYSIKRSTGFVGPWNNDNAVSLSDGYENVAVNKAANQAPGFYLYSISRTAYEAGRRNSAKLETEGWSKVTATTGLGLTGYYYTLLDVSEAGYESGFAMTGATGGRPQSQALTDPTTNKAQLWIVEPHDADKFALKCVQDSKYFRCDGAGWNTGFTTDINADGTDFAFTAADGKWTLSNEKDAGNFVGRWGNSVFHPFQGESIAANKAAAAGKKLYLVYSIPTIAGVAIELPSTGDMAADTWYYIDIAAAANNYTATASPLSDIVYTSDGTKLVRDGGTITTNFAATDNSLEAIRYYVKSATANNLKIAAATFSYNVGTATADMLYIQPGKTVTVTYADLATNSTTATLTTDFSNVTLNGTTISCTATSNGFTFVVPDVTADNTYSLVIPANAIGYSEGSLFNAEQTITLKSPSVFDGTYYLYNPTTTRFLARGLSYGTAAMIDFYGVPFTLTVDSNDGSAKMVFLDNNQGLFNGGGDDVWCWTDNTATSYEFVIVQDGYNIKTKGGAADKFIHVSVADNYRVGFKGDATLWQLKTPAERNAVLAAYTTDNYQHIITAASLATTTAEFESYLTTNYAGKDYTDKVGTAKITDAAGDWTWTGVRGQGGQPAYNNAAEAWVATGSWTQTIENLPEGIYRVKINAFERRMNNADSYALGEAGYGNVTSSCLKANDEQVRLKSWYEEVVKNGDSYVPNTMGEAVSAFNNDKYKSEVYTYVGSDGKLTLTIAKPNYIWDCWLLWNNVTLTYFTDQVDPAEVTALLGTADEYLQKPMLATLKQAISDAKDALESSISIANYNALQEAIDNSQTSVDSYASMKTNYLDLMKALLESTNVYQASLKTSLYDNYLQQYNDGTISNADANALKAYDGDKGTRPVDNLLMPSWTIGGAATGNKFYQNTWSNEGASDNTNFLLPFYEYWVAGDKVLEATTLQATQEGLQPGYFYEVSAWVRVQESTAGSKIANGITMQVGDGEAVDVTDGEKIGETTRYIKEYKAYGQADASGNLIIKFNVADGSNISWLAFKNLKYQEASVYQIMGVYNDWDKGYMMTQSTEAGKEDIYTVTTEVNVVGGEADNYFEYKLRKGNDWDGYQLPAQGNGNNSWKDQVDGIGIYTLAFTADVANHTLTCTAVKSDFTYAVVGCTYEGSGEVQSPLFTGTRAWDTENTTDIMTKQADGTWVWRKNEVDLPAQWIDLKVVAKNGDDVVKWFGNSSNGNVGLDITTAATYYVTVTFNGTIVTANAEQKYAYTVAGGNAELFGTTWAPGATDNDMTRNDEGIYVKAYENKELTAGTFEYKVVRDHSWDVSYGYNGNNATATIPADGKYHVVFTFNPTTEATGCEVIPATVTKNVTAAKYATYCSPYALDFTGSNLTAYIAELSGTDVTFVEVTSVPANTGVLLKADAAGDFTIKTALSSDTNVDANKLVGVLVDTKVPAGSFVLMNGTKGAGFYKAANEFTVGANTAYLPALPSINPARDFIGFGDDTTTGIEALSTKAMDGEVYNLQGQRVNKAHKGLYIVNGKKVVLK